MAATETPAAAAPSAVAAAVAEQAPPATDNADDKQKAEKRQWPQPPELERWLIGACEAGTHSSMILRGVLRQHPSCIPFMSADEELAGIVKLHAKRVRSKIPTEQGQPPPPGPESFYQPLCEAIWHALGMMLHTIGDLDGAKKMPTSEEAKGQVRMLLQANATLNSKLNDTRRQYLRELQLYRDKERTIGANTEKAIASLDEAISSNPVMFWDPLDAVIDETTKQFVRDTIEERMKLEMQTAFRNNDQNAEVAGQLEALEQKIADMETELKGARREKAAEATRAQKLENQLEMWKTKFDEEKAKLDDMQKERDEAVQKATQFEDENRRHVRKIAFLENGGKDAGEKTAEAQEQIDSQAQQINLLKQQLEDAQKDREAQRLALEAQQKEMEEMIKDHAEDLEKASENSLKGAEKQGADKNTPSKIEFENLQASEKELKKENKEMAKELERLRETLKNCTCGGRGGKDVPTTPGGSVKRDGASKKELEEIEAQKADLEKALGKKDKELEKLREKLAALEGSRPAVAGDPELQKKYDDLQSAYSVLEEKVARLVEKLKAKCGAEEVEDVMKHIKLDLPPPKKPRKKNAFERLYADAQRRVVDLKKKRESLSKCEDEAIKDFATKIRNRRSIAIVENLSKLQSDSATSSSKFYDAVMMAALQSKEADGNAPNRQDGNEESSNDDGVSPEPPSEAQRLWGRMGTTMGVGAGRKPITLGMEGLDESGRNVCSSDQLTPTNTSPQSYGWQAMRGHLGFGAVATRQSLVHDPGVPTGVIKSRASIIPGSRAAITGENFLDPESAGKDRGTPASGRRPSVLQASREAAAERERDYLGRSMSPPNTKTSPPRDAPGARYLQQAPRNLVDIGGDVSDGGSPQGEDPRRRSASSRPPSREPLNGRQDAIFGLQDSRFDRPVDGVTGGGLGVRWNNAPARIKPDGSPQPHPTEGGGASGSNHRPRNLTEEGAARAGNSPPLRASLRANESPHSRLSPMSGPGDSSLRGASPGPPHVDSRGAVPAPPSTGISTSPHPPSTNPKPPQGWMMLSHNQVSESQPPPGKRSLLETRNLPYPAGLVAPPIAKLGDVPPWLRDSPSAAAAAQQQQQRPPPSWASAAEPYDNTTFSGDGSAPGARGGRGSLTQSVGDRGINSVMRMAKSDSMPQLPPVAHGNPRRGGVGGEVVERTMTRTLQAQSSPAFGVGGGPDAIQEERERRVNRKRQSAMKTTTGPVQRGGFDSAQGFCVKPLISSGSAPRVLTPRRVAAAEAAHAADRPRKSLSKNFSAGGTTSCSSPPVSR